MQAYLKSLNPKTNQQAILIYNAEYDLWREGKYLGKGVWTKDENVGDSFQRPSSNERHPNMKQVIIADKWQITIKTPSNGK